MLRRLDHLVYAVADLDVAAADFASRFDLEMVGSGEHDGVGTANVLLSLGSSYLELMTVTDPASPHPLVRRLQVALSERDQLIGFAIEVDDIKTEAARLGTTPIPMSRQGELPGDWYLTGIERAMAGVLPFFIQWQSGRPGSTSRNRLSLVELIGDLTELTSWIGGPVDGLALGDGEPGLRAYLDDGSRI